MSDAVSHLSGADDTDFGYFLHYILSSGLGFAGAGKKA